MLGLSITLDTVDSVDKITKNSATPCKASRSSTTSLRKSFPRSDGRIESGATQTLTLTLQSTLHSLVVQLDPFISPLIDMAQAFDNAKNDDFFFLPPDALKTADFKVGMDFFMTPDGKGARSSSTTRVRPRARKASNRSRM